MKKIIDTGEAPAAVGAYSQAVKAGDLIFTSGQLPIDPETGEFSDDVKEQAAQSMKNIGAILKAEGGGYADIVKTTVLLADIADFAAVNEVYESFFNGEYPARSCFQAAALPKGASVEIEAIAYIK